MLGRTSKIRSRCGNGFGTISRSFTTPWTTDGVANHFGFGLGKHFCIGYQLARAEICAAAGALLQRRPGLRIADGHQPRLRIDWFHRHLDGLVVET